jgi:hypothetical protein
MALIDGAVKPENRTYVLIINLFLFLGKGDMEIFPWFSQPMIVKRERVKKGSPFELRPCPHSQIIVHPQQNGWYPPPGLGNVAAYTSFDFH